MRPWTGITDVEVIPALLRWKLSTRLTRDPIAERADLSLELARLVGPISNLGSLTKYQLVLLSYKNTSFQKSKGP